MLGPLLTRHAPWFCYSVVRSPGVDVWERWRGAARSWVDVCHTRIVEWVYVRSYRMDGYERERVVSLSMYILQDGVLLHYQLFIDS